MNYFHRYFLNKIRNIKIKKKPLKIVQFPACDKKKILNFNKQKKFILINNRKLIFKKPKKSE